MLKIFKFLRRFLNKIFLIPISKLSRGFIFNHLTARNFLFYFRGILISLREFARKFIHANIYTNSENYHIVNTKSIISFQTCLCFCPGWSIYPLASILSNLDKKVNSFGMLLYSWYAQR